MQDTLISMSVIFSPAAARRFSTRCSNCLSFWHRHLQFFPLAGFIDAVRHSSDESDRSRQIFCHWEVVSNNLDPSYIEFWIISAALENI